MIYDSCETIFIESHNRFWHQRRKNSIVFSILYSSICEQYHNFDVFQVLHTEAMILGNIT